MPEPSSFSTAGIVLKIYDANTGQPLEGVTAVFASAGYTETVDQMARDWDDGSYSISGAADRPGLYDIAVSRTGYLTWSRSGVEVKTENCRVLTTKIDVYLTPSV